MAIALDDNRPPITIDEVYTHYRDDMLRLAWVITWEPNNEDFVHDFYLHEKRRGRIAGWDGRCRLSSWIMTTMRWYKSNINQVWRQDRPLYDMSRPWSSWTDSTSMSYDWPLYQKELRASMDATSQTTFDWMLADKNQKTLSTWPSIANKMAGEVRHALQDAGGLLETGGLWDVDGRVVQDMLAQQRYGHY